MMVTDPILPDHLQQTERALNIRPEERLRIRDAVVIMRLGRVMHDRVMTRHDPVQQIRVADITHDQFHTVLGQARDVLRIARVRELVQHGHMHVRMMVHHVMHEIRSDETAATGHDNVLGNKRLFNIPRFTTTIHLHPIPVSCVISEKEIDLCIIFQYKSYTNKPRTHVCIHRKFLQTPFQRSFTPQLAIVYAFRIHKLPFNRGLPLQKQRQVFAKIIVIAATIFIDILPFSTL